eukprot:m.492817 g.492817  ORF g.492817 m.492817 type:complete len:434 (-) comp34263_c0_seq1:137-1438(-)
MAACSLRLSVPVLPAARASLMRQRQRQRQAYMHTTTTTCTTGWLAGDVSDPSAWLHVLTEDDREELYHATMKRAAAVGGVGVDHLNRPSVCAQLREPLACAGLEAVACRVRKQVLDGNQGFAVVRNFPTVGYRPATATAPSGRATEADESFTYGHVVSAYLGVAAHLGMSVPQNRHGHLVGHVRDERLDPKDPTTRIYQTAARQRFHVDSCDVVGLLCLRPARRGGESSLVSSLALVARLRETHPELLQVLEQPFVYDRKGEVPPGCGPHYTIPIVHHHRGFTSVYFARDFIEAAQARFPATEVPRLTSLQVKALDTLERLAESDEFRLTMTLQPGDVQFVHNHVLLHAREAYEDGGGDNDSSGDSNASSSTVGSDRGVETDSRRHLLRLWLSPAPQDQRPLPAVFEKRYGPLDARPRGGIRVDGVIPSIPGP